MDEDKPNEAQQEAKRHAKLMERSALVTRRVPVAISKSSIIAAAIFIIALVALLFIQVTKLGLSQEKQSKEHEHEGAGLEAESTGETAVHPTPTATPLPPSDPASEQLAEELWQKLQTANAYDRAQFALQLRDTGRPGMEKLTKALDSDRAEIRRVAANVLSFCQYKPSLPKLRALATADSSAEVRENAVYALGRCDGDRALPVLEQALRDTSIHVRRSAARALATLSERGYADKKLLLAALQNDDAEVRRDAAAGLLAMGDPSLADVFLGALKDTDAGVRAAAAQGLGKLKVEKAAPELLRMITVIPRLEEPDWLARSRAAEALGAILQGKAKSDDPVAAEASVKLDQSMNLDDQPIVRHFANKALQQMGVYTSKAAR